MNSRLNAYCQKYLPFYKGFVISVVVTFVAITKGFGQDIHFSLFEMSPLNLNPASTGDYVGDYRFNASHRNQWRSVTVPYTTFALSADMNYFLKKKFLSSGIQFNQDRAGDSRFNTFQANWSGAYHYYFKTDSLKKLTFGLQTGITNRNLVYDDLEFDAQYDGFQYNSNLSNQETFSRDARTYLNLNTGVLYSQQIDENKTIKAGVAFSNLTRPKQSFFNDESILLDVRMSFHTSAVWKINEKFSALPTILLMRQGKYTSFNIGGNVRYTFIDFAGVYRAVWGGVFYRNRDAAYLSLGVDYDNWKAGISYDINISTLTPASNYRGSFEVAIQYIINKKPFQRVMHRVCPDYI